MAMVTSPSGVKAIQADEGTVLEAYQDIVGVWTIGVGHTGSKYAQPGVKITKAKALELLHADLSDAEDAVNNRVKVPLTQKQFDALVSLVFNIGVGAFAKSTLLRKLNKGDYFGAADQFTPWNKAGGKVVGGLVRRRAGERARFLEGTAIPDEEPNESNLIADAPVKPSVRESRPIQALGATGVAGTLSVAAENVAPLAEYSDYIRILWIMLVLAGIGYFIYQNKQGG